MSVRATERLVGDLVKVSSLPNSPQMVVKTFDVETKIITTAWFSDCNAYQEGFFPSAALDRVEPKAAPQTVKAKKSGKSTAKSK